MADCIKNLQTYVIQLEQVEAALLTDPNNEELKKLQVDLQEVITLTKGLPELEASSSSNPSIDANDIPIKQWKVGDLCSCIWPEDGKWYNAIIDAVTEDGIVAVTFQRYGNSTMAKTSALREPQQKEDGDDEARSSFESDKNKKRLTEHQRLMAKKKKQKKFDRQKLIEEAHESDKKKWQAFNTKFTKSKTKLKGVNRKSIFATPEAANGRVGIGTCGIGGRPMTEFTQAEKWRKGT